VILSVVIPVLNEAESLERLHAELCEVAAAHGYELDVILVDDGSTDSSWDVICRLAKTGHVRGIRFRRNFGKAAALAAGVAEARGELIMTMDADLQDDPHEIPNFLARIEEGFDVVSGWKRVRHDPWHKVLPSRLFNATVSWLTGVWLHDHNCGMKCYRREVFDEVELFGDRHRFIPVLAAARGFRATELVIHHRARQFGRSKYGWSRLPKGFFDLLTVKFVTSYGYRPQHLLGTLGLVSLLLGLVGLAASAAGWLQRGELAAVAMSSVLTLLGPLLIGLGLLAELIVAVSPRKQPYSIVARTSETTAESL
jgi:dolichol-phosphate mannosyltransferase